MRYASVYIRLSRASDDENLSLEGMTKDTCALASRLGFTVLEPIHIDDGKTGGRRDRPGFKEWLDDAVSGRVHALLTPSIDRLTREGLNVAAQILDVQEGKDPETGKEVRTPVRLADLSGIDSDHGDAFRFRFVIQAEVGRSERERMRARARSRVRNLSAAGRYGGGPIAYGLRKIKNPEGAGFILEVNPDEAATLTLMISDALSGYSMGRIARSLTHLDFKTRRGNAWTRQAVTTVLRGKVLVDYGIASHAEHKELCKLLAPSGGNRAGRHPARLLSGLLTCYGCGRTMHVREHRIVKGESVADYQCPARHTGIAHKGAVSITSACTEPYVTSEFLRLHGDRPMVEERVVVAGGSESLRELDADIALALEELGKEATAEGFAKLKDLQARRTAVEAEPVTRRTELVATGQTIAEYWAGAMLDDRRDLLRQTFAGIVISPGRRGVARTDRIRIVP